MKKCIAIALSVALAFLVTPFALSDNAFAANVHGFPIGMKGGADVLNGDEILDFGDRVLGTDTITMTIPLYWQGFDGATSDASLNEDVMDRIQIGFTDPTTAIIFREKHKVHYEHGRPARLVLNAEAIGLAQGEVYIYYVHDDYDITVSKGVPINGRIIDPTINKAIVGLTGLDIGDYEVRLDDQVIDPVDLDNLVVFPGSTLRFKLHTDYFEWDPLIDDMLTSVRKSTLDIWKVGVRAQYYKGKELIQSAKIENVSGLAYVYVRFIDPLPYVDEMEFDFKIGLSFKGKLDERTVVYVKGTISNELMDATDQEYIYLGDGSVAFVRKATTLKVDLGNGITVHRTLFPGKKYYGLAKDNRTQDDIDIMEYFPGIIKVVNLTTVNMETPGDEIVSFKIGEEENETGYIKPYKTDYFIYDEDGILLGMDTDMVPYRNKYYLSLINLAESLDNMGYDGEVIGSVSLENPNSGGDDEPFGNIHDNPGTGAWGGTK